MAVPFYVPGDDDQATGGSGGGNGGEVSGGQSALHSPLPSPVPEHLMQAFCEALYRYSRGGSVESPNTPTSPSCSRGGYFYFPPPPPPQSGSQMSTPASARSLSQQFFAGDEHLLYTPPSHLAYVPPRRLRLTSTGDEEDENCASDAEMNDELREHYQYLAARDRLQEFAGQLPPPKNRNKTSKRSELKKMIKEQSFTWPTVVTAVVIAVGCGILVSR